MALHGAVIGIGIRALVQGAKVFAKYEGKTYTKLYGQARGRGVRHGLAGGGVIGSFIKDDNGIEPDGKVQKPNGSKTGKSNQARFRQFSNYSFKRRARVQHCNCNRYSYSRKYRRR